MERLTQTSDKGGVAFTFDLTISCEPNEAKKILKLAEKLKQYEDLEEQGQLLRLPCRPNDIVYRINKAARVPIIKMAVKRIVLFDKSYALEVVDEYGGQLLFLADDIGKVLYITREEAEAKLKELEESHD